MKYIVVGDLHGRIEVAKFVRDTFCINPEYTVIWLDDCLDSYDRSIDDQIKCLEIMLTSPNSQYVFSNHGISYFGDGVTPCSGYKLATRASSMHYKNQYLAQGKKFIWLDGVTSKPILITHAGVSQDYLEYLAGYPEEMNLTPEQVHSLLLENLPSPEKMYREVGMARGGYLHCGSPLWCDFDSEFVPIPGVYQVFGHTWNKEGIIRSMEADGTISFNIDCLGNNSGEILEISNDGFCTITIETMTKSEE